MLPAALGECTRTDGRCATEGDTLIRPPARATPPRRPLKIRGPLIRHALYTPLGGPRKHTGVPVLSKGGSPALGPLLTMGPHMTGGCPLREQKDMY